MTMNDDASFWIVLAFIGIGAIGAAFEVVRSMRGYRQCRNVVRADVRK